MFRHVWSIVERQLTQFSAFIGFTTGFPEKYGNVNSTECFSGALDAASFANVRLDQLFFEWLLLPETAELLECFNDNIQLSCNALVGDPFEIKMLPVLLCGGIRKKCYKTFHALLRPTALC